MWPSGVGIPLCLHGFLHLLHHPGRNAEWLQLIHPHIRTVPEKHSCYYSNHIQTVPENQTDITKVNMRKNPNVTMVTPQLKRGAGKERLQDKHCAWMRLGWRSNFLIQILFPLVLFLSPQLNCYSALVQKRDPSITDQRDCSAWSDQFRWNLILMQDESEWNQTDPNTNWRTTELKVWGWPVLITAGQILDVLLNQQVGLKQEHRVSLQNTEQNQSVFSGPVINGDATVQ